MRTPACFSDNFFSRPQAKFVLSTIYSLILFICSLLNKKIGCHFFIKTNYYYVVLRLSFY